MGSILPFPIYHHLTVYSSPEDAMTPEIEAEIMSMEWVIDPPPGSPVRENGYCTTKLPGIPFQIVIPRYKVGDKVIWERTKVKGDTYELARDEARRVLLALETKHRSGISLDPKHLGFATAAKARLVAAGHVSPEDYETMLDIGCRGLIAQKAFMNKYNKTKPYIATKDIVNVGGEELERLALSVQEAVDAFVNKIDPPDDAPTREKNTQAEAIGAHLKDMVKHVGKDTPFIEIMRDDERLRAWIVKRIIKKDGEWDLTTRRRALQNFRRFCRAICPPRNFPQPSAELICRRPEGKTKPIIAIPPEIVERLHNLVEQKAPKRLIFVVLQDQFGLRPDEAWKLLQELGDYLHEDCLVVPEHISKTKVQRVIWIRPSARACLKKALAAWPDKRTSIFLEERYRGKNGAKNIQAYVNKVIKSAGWKPRVPKEALRKCWITACVVMGVPIEEKLLQEAGHESVEMLLEHYLDPTWKRHMGRTYFSMFLEGNPDKNLSDYELCHAFDQQP
jgi:integrase